jgi:hypothetical protein
VPEARVGLLVSAFAVASALAAIPVTAVLRGGIAAGSLAGGPVLGGAGAAALPLGHAGVYRRRAGHGRNRAFPRERRPGRGIPARAPLLPRA